MNAPATWLDERRAEAANRFAALGVPHRRIEDWKYSDLKTAIEGANDDAAASWSVGTLPEGVELFDLSHANAPAWVQKHFGTLPQNAMASASFAHARTGFALRVSRDKAPGSLAVDFAAAGSARALIVLEEDASLTLCETNKASGFSNLGVEIVIGANAQLTHIRHAPRTDAVQVEEYAVRVARDGTYRAHLFNGGAKLSRAEFQIALAGENAQAHLSGVSVLGNGAHADVTTHVIHAVGHTQSTQLFKKVAGGKSRGVYQGRITVEQGADKSDSRQTAKALLMGTRAEADLKPELEIFADDVKCAHGAAVGDLDPNSLFYLRARGIPEAEARNMLVRAFLEEAVDEIADETIRATIWEAVEDALPKAMQP
ncbi:MAG: Fe-S cluster assembly protein SufD [Alphaproteobacteria bacterium]|nr:Fe-S cluster assembly protein SufD [Alphaproteobacteria bacterium]MBL6939284.1 Fe-S cluster assembly protein SufD [Alphaproteobacteria bacterium]MBL7096800.1 Fe-S cluster assembly protein SufD [Alphaproteobacteria bacterium]